MIKTYRVVQTRVVICITRVVICITTAGGKGSGGGDGAAGRPQPSGTKYPPSQYNHWRWDEDQRQYNAMVWQGNEEKQE